MKIQIWSIGCNVPMHLNQFAKFQQSKDDITVKEAKSITNQNVSKFYSLGPKNLGSPLSNFL